MFDNYSIILLQCYTNMLIVQAYTYSIDTFVSWTLDLDRRSLTTHKDVLLI